MSKPIAHVNPVGPAPTITTSTVSPINKQEKMNSAFPQPSPDLPRLLLDTSVSSTTGGDKSEVRRVRGVLFVDVMRWAMSAGSVNSPFVELCRCGVAEDVKKELENREFDPDRRDKNEVRKYRILLSVGANWRFVCL